MYGDWLAKNSFSKNFLNGVGSVVSVLPRKRRVFRPNYPGMYWTSLEALRSDWLRIGDDMRAAYTQGSKELGVPIR